MDTSNNHQANNSQHSRSADLPAGWSRPAGGHIPEPTYMPVVLAVGIMCIFWGIVTTYLITLVGFVLFVVALSGWIGELRHEHRHS